MTAFFVSFVTSSCANSSSTTMPSAPFPAAVLDWTVIVVPELALSATPMKPLRFARTFVTVSVTPGLVATPRPLPSLPTNALDVTVPVPESQNIVMPAPALELSRKAE